MIREMDLVSYLPVFMRNYREPAAALEAENEEFEIVWDTSDRVLRNRFIETADEYGISRFEAMLGIYPSEEDTLELRRERVRSKWFDRIPYTWKILLQRLTQLCGDTGFVLTHNFETGYTLFLETELELFGQTQELERLLLTILPCNIVIDSKNMIPMEAEGTAPAAGGACLVHTFRITNDWRENNVVTVKGISGGGVSCFMIKDFRD